MSTDAEAFLIQVHDAFPGCTSRAFERGEIQDSMGGSTYDRLAHHLRHTGGRAFLDLACGDGKLLELLRDPALSLVGVDFSRGELENACIRLSLKHFQDSLIPHLPLQLLRGRAQRLPFEAESLDGVACHMALMLMTPVDEVLRELDRVLKPGGVFVAILGASLPDSAFTRRLRRALQQAISPSTTELGDKRPFPVLGDRRCTTEEGLRSLFVSNGLSEPTLQLLEICFEGNREEYLAFFLETYDGLVLTESQKHTFGRALLSDADPTGTADRLRWTVYLRALYWQKPRS